MILYYRKRAERSLPRRGFIFHADFIRPRLLSESFERLISSQGVPMDAEADEIFVRRFYARYLRRTFMIEILLDLILPIQCSIPRTIINGLAN